MPHSLFRTILTILVTLLIGFAAPATAFADDETPPPATETPAEEEPVAPDPEPAPVTDILEPLPEETQIIALDEEGNVEPLATEEAAEIIATGDPIWCPEGVAPSAGSGGCTDPGPGNSNYDPSSLQSLLNYLQANQPTQAGVIWIEKTYDSSLNDPAVTGFTINGSSFTIMRDYAITIQGGWSGVGGDETIDHADPSVFNGDYFHIENWNADVAINDISITGVPASAPGLEVTTTGGISINRTKSNNNADDGASLDNASGIGIVLVESSQFNNNSGSGLFVNSNGAITLNNVRANGNGAIGAYLNNIPAGGQALTVGGGSQFNNNAAYGLVALSDGDITLDSISASGNGHAAPYYPGAIFDTLANAVVCASRFNHNGGYGFEASLPGTLTHGNNAYFGNGAGAYLIYGGATAIADETLCGASPEREPRKENLRLQSLPVTGGQGIDLDCSIFDGTQLVLASGDSVMFLCPIEGTATLTQLSGGALPGGLTAGSVFVSSMEAGLSPERSGALPGKVIVSFVIPKEMKDANLAILYWDGQWLNLADAAFDDGRVVFDPGHKTADGHFEAATNFIGIFLLLQK